MESCRELSRSKKRQKNQYQSNYFKEGVLKDFTGMVYLQDRELCITVKIIEKFLQPFMGDSYFPIEDSFPKNQCH